MDCLYDCLHGFKAKESLFLKHFPSGEEVFCRMINYVNVFFFLFYLLFLVFYIFEISVLSNNITGIIEKEKE